MESKFKIFVIVAIVVLAGAIAASTFFVLRALNSTQTETIVVEDASVNLKPVELGEAILTNISSENEKVQHFAKVKISIGVDSTNEKEYTALTTEITEKASSIRSAIITTLGEQTYSMLNAASGKEKLADEIITRLNTLLDTDLIREVYYEEYFIQ